MPVFFLAILSRTPGEAAWFASSHSSHSAAEAKKMVGRRSLTDVGETSLSDAGVDREVEQGHPAEIHVCRRRLEPLGSRAHGVGAGPQAKAVASVGCDGDAGDVAAAPREHEHSSGG